MTLELVSSSSVMLGDWRWLETGDLRMLSVYNGSSSNTSSEWERQRVGVIKAYNRVLTNSNFFKVLRHEEKIIYTVYSIMLLFCD